MGAPRSQVFPVESRQDFGDYLERLFEVARLQNFFDERRTEVARSSEQNLSLVRKVAKERAGRDTSDEVFVTVKNDLKNLGRTGRQPTMTPMAISAKLVSVSKPQEFGQEKVVVPAESSYINANQIVRAAAAYGK